MPERFDRVRLCAPLLSDLVLDIALGACEAVELVLKRSDPGLADTRFLQLRQGFLGEVLESGAIDLGAATEGRRRQTQGNADFALDLRERLELLQARNIDMEHRPSLPAAGRPSFMSNRAMLAETPHTGIDGHQSRRHLQRPGECATGG